MRIGPLALYRRGLWDFRSKTETQKLSSEVQAIFCFQSSIYVGKNCKAFQEVQLH